MRNGHLNLMALALMFMPAIAMSLLALRFHFKRPNWNAQELARVGGVQAVGTLIDLLAAPKAPRHLTPLYAALTELLPQMKASESGLLTPGERKMLLWTLKNGFSANVKPAVILNYRLAILKALEQAGDAAAIPAVMRLANEKARTVNQKALKAAAQECLPLLRSAFGGVEVKKTLLRASSPENAASETLLRPVEFTPDANPRQLLRVANTTVPPPAA